MGHFAMGYVRSAVKFAGAQALSLFIIFNIVIWIICLGFSVANLVKRGPGASQFGKRVPMANLPNYAGVDWARTHFVEIGSLSSVYVSYIGWRRKPFHGQTITLDGPYAQRATVGSASPDKPSVYFFGGSTMWGTGSDDANTIPSLVTQLGGFRSENYGESAYTAHQSLALLIQLLQEGHRPNVVVFYDGANDVSQKCRSELTAKSHAREAQISAALATAKPQNAYGLQYMAGPFVGLAAVVSNGISERRRDSEGQYFACHTDPLRAQQIADYLFQDWEVARRLVESYGGKFIGILQPVAYYSSTKLAHLQLGDTLKQQFEAVYPLVRKRMAGQPNLYDFTDVLDRQEYHYIDFCHLSPNGNRYVAERLVEVLVALKP